MTFPTARTALQGNPPTPGYSPRKADLVNVLEQMQAIAAVQVLRDFHGALEDLPTGGNETGDKRAVLAPEAEGGGVYRWDGATWDLVSALPVVLTQSLSAELAQAWAEGTAPGGSGTRSAREWAMVSGDNGRLEIGTVTTLDAGEPATATITGPTGEQELNLGIPDGVDGWTPQLALVSDGTRRVLQVIDWTGGEGEKPATGLYVGPAGLIADMATATDIRGIPGEGDMSTPVYDPQGIGADAFNASNMASGNLPMARTPTLTTASNQGAILGRNSNSGDGAAGQIGVSLINGLTISSGELRVADVGENNLKNPVSSFVGGLSGGTLRPVLDDYAEKFAFGVGHPRPHPAHSPQTRRPAAHPAAEGRRNVGPAAGTGSPRAARHRPGMVMAAADGTRRGHHHRRSRRRGGSLRPICQPPPAPRMAGAGRARATGRAPPALRDQPL